MVTSLIKGMGDRYTSLIMHRLEHESQLRLSVLFLDMTTERKEGVLEEG